MEIQKIYSDLYDEERLYSVLMEEDEIRMFTGVVKARNKELKKLWQMKKGEKVLTDRGLKKYMSTENYRTELAPEFRDTKNLLKEGRNRKTGMTVGNCQEYRDASIHDRINAKAGEYFYPRGKRATINPHPRSGLIGMYDGPVQKLSHRHILIGQGI